MPPGPLAHTSCALQDQSCNMAAQVCFRGRLMKLHSCVWGGWGGGLAPSFALLVPH